VAAEKRLRMELLQTKAELERELGRFLLHWPAVQPACALGARSRAGARARIQKYQI
jgi:hypothetical protein